MRVVLIVLGLLFGVPILGTMVLQLYAAMVVADVAMDVSDAMAEAEAAANAQPSTKYPVENVKSDRSLRQGYEALVNLGEPVRERSIVFNAYVRLSDLLKEGEEVPADDFAEVFASARASAYAEAECGRVLDTFASHCAVARASANAVSGEEDLYNISAALSFVQKDPLGDVPADAQFAYREIRDDLTSGARSVTVMPSQAERQRERFYEEAARQCDRLRRSEGNCALYRIMIRANPKRGSDGLEMTGQAQLSFLQRAGGG